MLLVFLAGHGTLQGDLYYFLPHDARLETSESVEASSISSMELADMLSNVGATKQLIILDSCHSGGAGRVLSKHLASRDAVGLIRSQQALARASGTFLIAASRARQSAKEYPALGHGVLTFAILQGLGAIGEAAAAVDADGRVTVNALLQYISTEVPRLEQKHGDGAQDVVQYSTGHDFPLVVGRSKTSETRVQEPGAFRAPCRMTSPGGAVTGGAACLESRCSKAGGDAFVTLERAATTGPGPASRYTPRPWERTDEHETRGKRTRHLGCGPGAPGGWLGMEFEFHSPVRPGDRRGGEGIREARRERVASPGAAGVGLVGQPRSSRGRLARQRHHEQRSHAPASCGSL